MEKTVGEPASAHGDSREVSRSGRMPEPTVTVRMKEDGSTRGVRRVPASCLGTFSPSIRGERFMIPIVAGKTHISGREVR